MRKRTSDKERKFLPIADALAVQKGYSDEEIFAAVGQAVSMSWILRKRKEMRWNERHTEMKTSVNYIAEAMRRMLANTVRMWDKEGATIDGKVADMFSKVTSNIKKLEENFDILASTQIIVDNFVEYLTKEAHDPRAYDALMPHIVEFTQYMRAKYRDAS